MIPVVLDSFRTGAPMTTSPDIPDAIINRPKARKIKVGMILDQPFPPDARVEREATALVDAGYEVHLLCQTSEEQSITPSSHPREEYYRGIYVHRVNPQDVKFGIPLLNIQTQLPYKGLIKSLCHSFFNRDNAWYSLIDRFVHFYGLDILHVHDLRLVDTGLAVGDKHAIPVIADLHENYPALMEMLKGKHNPRQGTSARKKWAKIELRGAKKADRVITVIEEAKERLIEEGIEADKITVLPNTVDVEKFSNVSPSSDIIRQFKPWFLMTYVGHVNNSHRGIQTVLEALSILKPEIPELFFVAAGAVKEGYSKELQVLVDQYDLHHRVHFTGFLDESDFVHYIEASDICLIPHLATDHTNSTFPNKAYLYHLFKKPVIASDCKPLARYINDTQGGLVFPSGDVQELANQIRRLYYDTELKKNMGENGQQAVLSQYNWQQTAPLIVDLYQELVKEYAIR